MKNLAIAIAYETNYWRLKKQDPRLTKHDFLRLIDRQSVALAQSARAYSTLNTTAQTHV